jgi:GLPGLI family protein
MVVNKIGISEIYLLLIPKKIIMKKFYLFFLSLAAIAAFSFTNSTSDFEGKIVYSISVDGGNLPPEAKAMFEGSEMTTYIKDMKSRTDMTMGFQNPTTIRDGKTKTSVLLMEIMGNKYKIKNDESTAKQPDATVKYSDETKEIAGYKCKKAEITFTDKTGTAQSSIIYYTEEISNHMGFDKRNSPFKDIKGMPLEFEVQAQRGMTMKMSAKSVSKETVPSSQFDIPSGYKETTMEDMQKDMQQMMQQQH